MKGKIYKVTNKVTGKSYIGQTRYTIEARWKQHQHKDDGTYFHNAIKKYGVDAFIVEELEECDIKDLDSREIYYIAKYDTFKNGYNLTIGGAGPRIIEYSKYDEIRDLYLSGFTAYKIGTLYNVDKSVILKILHSLGVKLRKKEIKLNHQEFLELVKDYQSGYSFKALAKRYDCTAPALKDYMIRKGVDIREKYSILNDQKNQDALIFDYTSSTMKLSEIQAKYHCSYNTLLKVLSLNGITKGKYNNPFKMSDKECLEAIKMFNEHIPVKDIAKHFKVDKCTIYSMFRRYKINYLTV